MSAFGKGLFGSDTLINAMVSSIPLKYLKILESDNLDMDQVLINLEYLEEAERNLLYPKEILMLYMRTDPQAFGNENFVSDIESRLSYTERQKFLIKMTTPSVIRIAYNLLLPGSDGVFFLPRFLQENPKQFFWYIAAYPDVIDFFYPTREAISPKKYKDNIEEYFRYFDDVKTKASKEMDLFEEYVRKNQMDLFEEYVRKNQINLDLDSLDFLDFLTTLKNYYKTILHKKYALEK
jgi:hypothetical protein